METWGRSKKKLEEIKTEQRSLTGNLNKLSAEEKVQKELKKAMSFIDQWTKMISEADEMKDMKQIEAGQKLIRVWEWKAWGNREKAKGYCSGKNQDTGKTYEM